MPGDVAHPAPPRPGGGTLGGAPLVIRGVCPVGSVAITRSFVVASGDAEAATGGRSGPPRSLGICASAAFAGLLAGFCTSGGRHTRLSTHLSVPSHVFCALHTSEYRIIHTGLGGPAIKGLRTESNVP
jgi:hypothetical protein